MSYFDAAFQNNDKSKQRPSAGKMNYLDGDKAISI